jgi:FtsH-binding integral membrane protein
VGYKTKTKIKTMNKFLMAAVIITALIVILSYFGGDDNETGFQS